MYSRNWFRESYLGTNYWNLKLREYVTPSQVWQQNEQLKHNQTECNGEMLSTVEGIHNSSFFENHGSENRYWKTKLVFFFCRGIKIQQQKAFFENLWNEICTREQKKENVFIIVVDGVESFEFSSWHQNQKWIGDKTFQFLTIRKTEAKFKKIRLTYKTWLKSWGFVGCCLSTCTRATSTSSATASACGRRRGGSLNEVHDGHVRDRHIWQKRESMTKAKITFDKSDSQKRQSTKSDNQRHKRQSKATISQKQPWKLKATVNSDSQTKMKVKAKRRVAWRKTLKIKYFRREF